MKPNRQELSDTVGASGMDGVLALRRRAPGSVVVASDGAVGLGRGQDWPSLLRAAIGAAGAALLDPVAGRLDLSRAREQALTATVEAY